MTDSNTNVTKEKILTIKGRDNQGINQGIKNAKLITDHTFTKSIEKNGRSYKKGGCLLVCNTKNLFISLEYKTPQDTIYNRDKVAKSVKKILSSLEQSKGQKEKVLDEDYHLSYLIQLPKGKCCYHNKGKAAEIAEPLDSGVTDFVKKLICSGCCRAKELESLPMDFVTGILFEDICSPNRYCGRFYPERRKIKNLIIYVKMETQFSKINQENFQHFVASCRKAKIYFTPR